jgi:hypothetical protein
MAIGNAVQRDEFIYIYNEQGQQTAVIPAGLERGDGLCGYTSSSVNVRKGHFIYSYNERGGQTNVVPA